MMDSPPPRREMRTLGARDMIRDRKESTFSTGISETCAVRRAPRTPAVSARPRPSRHISESIRERSGIATGTSFSPGPLPLCGIRVLHAALNEALTRVGSCSPIPAQIDYRRARFVRPEAAMPRQPSQRNTGARLETSLYVPVKRFLETLGFDVKGEVCGCDLVAIRGEEP